LQLLDFSVDVQQFVPSLERFSKEMKNEASMFPQFSTQHNSDLLWGTYRPNLYFGMRTRTERDTLLTGLLWYRWSSPIDIPKEFRHVVRNEDNVHYWWQQHNGRDYGTQLLNDTWNKIELTTTFMKFPGSNGGDWVVRINGSSSHFSKTQNSLVSLLFYFGIDHRVKGHLQLLSPSYKEGKPLAGPLRLSGYTPSTGVFIVDIRTDNEIPSHVTHISGMKVSDVWRVQRYLRIFYYNHTQPPTLENVIRPNSNLFVIQKYFKLPFQMEITFVRTERDRFQDNNAFEQYISSITGPHFTQLQKERSKQFETKFDSIFRLSAKGFSKSQILFAQQTLSNLLGGIGYFYGRNRIWKQPVKEGEQPWYFSPNERGLLTATPSRGYFPRGFLWDEGFHQLVIGLWDAELSRDMIASWLNLQDESGWIAREQILGEEAESRVPRDFIVQYPDNANPPTLHLAVDMLLSRNSMEQKKEENLSYLTGVLSRLTLYLKWLLTSQRGDARNSFRWRGSRGNHTLSSGLDDYPRFEKRTDFEEHLDLICWIAAASESLHRLNSKLHKLQKQKNNSVIESQQQYDTFERIRDVLVQHIHSRHWNKKSHVFADYEANTQTYSEHIGYVSLFPFLFGFIPTDSPRLKAVLDIMEDDKHLKTPYGLRSLSTKDPYYRKGENYWRSPVWINLNYLALRALKKFYIERGGPYQHRAQELYEQLRKNLITNVFKAYQKQRSIFEHYNDKTGKGEGQHPFAGWTSLIVLIMAEEF
jgi:mannosyl-oligosaccharide glucosidase